MGDFTNRFPRFLFQGCKKVIKKTVFNNVKYLRRVVDAMLHDRDISEVFNKPPTRVASNCKRLGS